MLIHPQTHTHTSSCEKPEGVETFQFIESFYVVYIMDIILCSMFFRGNYKDFIQHVRLVQNHPKVYLVETDIEKAVVVAVVTLPVLQHMTYCVRRAIITTFLNYIYSIPSTLSISPHPSFVYIII